MRNNLIIIIVLLLCNNVYALEATTTMTIINTGDWWPNSTCASPPAIVNYEVTERMYNVRISTNGVYYSISPGNTFDGGWARLWAFWSNNGGLTWFSSGWDYTTNNATFKATRGYGTGNEWVGQAISTICDQDHCPKDPKACNGRRRSNIIFVPNPDTRPADTSLLKIYPEDVGVFYGEGSQRFEAHRNGVDVTDNVDWYIEDYPFPGQPDNVITINSSGKATIHKTWGRVNIKACYPKGCKTTLPPPPPPSEPVLTGHLPSISLLMAKDVREANKWASLWMDSKYFDLGE